MKPEISKVRKRKRALQKGQIRVPEHWIHPTQKPQVQETLMRNVNGLPRELLFHILRQLRQSSRADHDGSFLNALTTCSVWHDIGKEIIWTDICITNTSLAKFSSSESVNLGLTRSLTLSFHTRLPIPNPPFVPASIREIYLPRDRQAQEMTLQTLALWEHLDKIPAVMERMKALESFSLVVSSPEGGSPGFYINHYHIVALLRALPASVQHLELDTEGFWDCKESHAENHHVCPAVRQLIPRLRSLRLRMRWLCEELLSLTSSLSGAVSREPIADAISNSAVLHPGSSVVKGSSFVINTTGPFEDTRQLHCFLLHEDHYQTHGLFVASLVTAMRIAISEGRLRQFGHCSIITLLDAETPVHGSTPRSALQSNTVFATVLLPYEAQCKAPALYGYGRYGPRPEHRNRWSAIRYPNRLGGAIDIEQIAPRRQISTVIEGDVVGGVWASMADGCRAPRLYLEQRPYLKGVLGPDNVFRRRTTLGRGIYQPLQPIWELEEACGIRLLRSEASHQLDDFQLLSRDMTPREKICRQRKEARKRGRHVPYDAFYDDVGLPDDSASEADEDAADGNPADGNQANGNQVDGNEADGNQADGNQADGNQADGNQADEDANIEPDAAAPPTANAGDNNEQTATDATTHDTTSFNDTQGSDNHQDASQSGPTSAGEDIGGETPAHEDDEATENNREIELHQGIEETQVTEGTHVTEETHVAEDTETVRVHSGEASIYKTGSVTVITNGQDEIFRKGEERCHLRSGEHAIMVNDFSEYHFLESGEDSITVLGDEHTVRSGQRCITTEGDRFTLQSDRASIVIGPGGPNASSGELSINQEHGTTVMRSGKLCISQCDGEYLIKYDGKVIAEGPLGGLDQAETHDTETQNHDPEPEKHDLEPEEHIDQRQSLNGQIDAHEQGNLVVPLYKQALFVVRVVGLLIMRICLIGTLGLVLLAINGKVALMPSVKESGN
ncbi:hypothetical protein EDD37DRAFT_647762 [Exophiala viscosa]|uniref:uncharacterized protein n=1 Tax=Exophiala viscosa TaxID=2486360 RepID=UPI002193E68C|nr:hypothetical protein EDD37DRAFT_647762 [Exophiala viscosa]